MPDLHTVLSEAAGDPAGDLDLDDVVRRGARRTARRRALLTGAGALPVVLAVALLHGPWSPSSTGGSDALSSVGGAASPSASGRSGQDAPGAPVPAPAAGRTVLDVSGQEGTSELGYRFLTPSRGIVCSVSHQDTPAGTAPGLMACEVPSNTWVLPPRPADCPVDFGAGVRASDGPAELTCQGDTMYDPALPVVPYGTTVVDRELSCDVDATGVSCRNTGTGARFSVSRQAYRLD